MRKTIRIAFSVWFHLVWLAALLPAEIKVEPVDIVTKTTTVERVESFVGDKKLSESSKDRATIESKRQAGLVTIGPDDGLLEVGVVLAIPNVGNIVVQATDYELQPIEGGLLFTAPKGVYILSVIDFFAAKTRSKAQIQFGDSPAPPPPPPPTDVFQSGWLVVVEETADRSAAAAVVLNNQSWWQGLTSRGYKWRFYDRDQAKPGHRAKAEAVGLPALLFIEEDGKVFDAVKLPGSVGEIDKRLKPLTAKKTKWVQICPGNGQPCYWVEVSE